MGHDHLKIRQVVARPLKAARGARDIGSRVQSPARVAVLLGLPRRWPPPCMSGSPNASHLGATELAASSHGTRSPSAVPSPATRTLRSRSRGCPTRASMPAAPPVPLAQSPSLRGHGPRDGTRPRGSWPRPARRSGSPAWQGPGAARFLLPPSLGLSRSPHLC